MSIGTDVYLYLLFLSPLSQREKDIITYLYRDGLSVVEVADKLNTSEPNIHKIKKSALLKLEKFISKTKNVFLSKIKSEYQF